MIFTKMNARNKKLLLARTQNCNPNVSTYNFINAAQYIFQFTFELTNMRPICHYTMQPAFQLYLIWMNVFRCKTRFTEIRLSRLSLSKGKSRLKLDVIKQRKSATTCSQNISLLQQAHIECLLYEEPHLRMVFCEQFE